MGGAIEGIAVDAESGKILVHGVSGRDFERLALVVRYSEELAIRMDVELDLEAFEGRTFFAGDTTKLHVANTFRDSARFEVADMHSLGKRYGSILEELC